ncbi:hypothetical protein [Chitinophaga rhizosphaerae]|uniref:hypothetical protein n=1 Tax=Chitinophaga rhizosphaerae TaxID=1864947 RepID=UPI000F8037A3|nr:hypothetical protein [Chitinophaga rhizosphaerae]
MKTIFWTFWLFLAAITEVCGQPADRRDSATIAAWRTAVRQAPVLTGATSPRPIVPHGASLCFNMEFDLKITMPGKMAEPANACLHTESFVPREEEYSRQANINIEKEKLDRAAHTGAGPCTGERALLFDFRKEQAHKREAALAQAREGNVYQQNSNAQRSLASMMDPLAVVQEDILAAKLEICKAENSTSARSREPIGCLNDQLSALMRIEGELRALDARHANQPGQAFAEKSKLYLRKKPRGCP